GDWLAKENRLVFVKGNHDLELYWPKVRNYLRLMLAQCVIRSGGGTEIYTTLSTTISKGVRFFDDSVVIDNDLYLEHGHRYDKYAMVLDGPFLQDKPGQLNIPFGSFFNRYLINRVELFYPFLDNVRPAGNLLP